MDEFDALLQRERIAVERYIRFRVAIRADADDLLQDTYVTAFQKFPALRNRDSFKAWLLSIARNKCNDYFRRKALQMKIPLEVLAEQTLSVGRHGMTLVNTVRETLSLLSAKDQQILYLYFWKELPQADIAKQLDTPVGTVKSRLYTAKQNFKSKHPYLTTQLKGDCSMKMLPKTLPEYIITESAEAPFAAKWEELMGWFLVPRLGECLSWGIF